MDYTRERRSKRAGEPGWRGPDETQRRGMIRGHERREDQDWNSWVEQRGVDDRTREFIESGRERNPEPGHLPLGNPRTLNRDPRSFPGDDVRSSQREPRYGTGSGLGAVGGKIEGRWAGVGPRAFRREDRRIHDEIADRLTEHPAIDPSEVKLAVKDGEVTLAGTVDSKRTRRAVEQLCWDVRGVSQVQNNLRVGGRDS